MTVVRASPRGTNPPPLTVGDRSQGKETTGRDYSPEEMSRLQKKELRAIDWRRERGAVGKGRGRSLTGKTAAGPPPPAAGAGARPPAAAHPSSGSRHRRREGFRGGDRQGPAPQGARLPRDLLRGLRRHGGLSGRTSRRCPLVAFGAVVARAGGNLGVVVGGSGRAREDDRAAFRGSASRRSLRSGGPGQSHSGGAGAAPADNRRALCRLARRPPRKLARGGAAGDP